MATGMGLNPYTESLEIQESHIASTCFKHWLEVQYSVFVHQVKICTDYFSDFFPYRI